MGLVENLSKITDHPKINVDAREYDRIDRDKLYFKGMFPTVKYSNTYGDQMERPYVSLNMMQVVSRRMASLLYNEQSKVSVDTREPSEADTADEKPEDDKANSFVQSVLNANDFGKNFERYLESCLAMGGLAIRPYVDNQTGQIKLAWIQAPNFFPLRSNTNDITDAAIATPTIRTEGGKTAYYTLLEFHEWSPLGYTVTNELYRSEMKDQVGNRVPLSMLYPDLADTVNMPGFSRPLFVYLKPAGFNNKSLNSPLGIGICDNALSTLKQLNDTYDQFNWEVRNGQRRIAVPESMTDVKFVKGGTEKAKLAFDPDQNVFVSVPGDPEKMSVTDLTTPIRASDYVTSMNQFLKTLEMQVGLSAGTFSFDGQSVKTATEVVSENSMTYQTRNSHLTMVERAIQELVVSICELGRATVINGGSIYNGPIPTIDQVAVDFDDGIFTDKAATADYWIKLQAAGLCADWQAIMHVQGVTEDQARSIAAEIAGDTADNATDPMASLFGGNGDNAAGDGGDD
ncbi:phage portal protein [Lacticaseibacillus salsurivasis]|uniref:phage portal protein n=1 Tax=Lacticaseibacillus salsurivasis TaxID=3081441 RepID=UPI0030C664B0